MQQPVAAQEQGVVARMAAGDRHALADLYARYQRPLLTYLLLLSSDPGLVEELLQDTLLAAWTGAGGYTGQASVQGWLLGIARRREHDVLRRRHLHLVAWSEAEALPTSHPEPEAIALARIDREELAAAVDRLAPVHREVLILTFVHELSYQDLVEVLGVPLLTVKSRLSNAKRALRALMRPEESAR